MTKIQAYRKPYMHAHLHVDWLWDLSGCLETTILFIHTAVKDTLNTIQEHK